MVDFDQPFCIATLTWSTTRSGKECVSLSMLKKDGRVAREVGKMRGLDGDVVWVRLRIVGEGRRGLSDEGRDRVES